MSSGCRAPACTANCSTAIRPCTAAATSATTALCRPKPSHRTGILSRCASRFRRLASCCSSLSKPPATEAPGRHQKRRNGVTASLTDWRARFEEVSARRAHFAQVPLSAVRTIVDSSGGFAVDAIGDAWSSAAFDGPFYQTPARDGLSMGLVFVQSRDGNTGTRNPSSLGGGAVDEHLIYEGLSRVAADAVVVGAGTLHPNSFFSIWRPELIELRLSRGLPRHPAQVLLTA